MNHVLSFQIDPELAERFKRAWLQRAAGRYVSRSALARELLARALDDMPPGDGEGT